jgi:hypothetical protein
LPDHRLGGFLPFFDAHQPGAQNGGQHQVGVHIAAGHAMFDPPRRRAA